MSTVSPVLLVSGDDSFERRRSISKSVLKMEKAGFHPDYLTASNKELFRSSPLGVSRPEAEESFRDIGVDEAEVNQGSEFFGTTVRNNPDGIERNAVDPTWIDLGVSDAAKNPNSSSNELVGLVKRPNPEGVSRAELDPNFQDIGVSGASPEDFSGELHPVSKTAPLSFGTGDVVVKQNDIYLRSIALACFGVLTGKARVNFPSTNRAHPSEWVRVELLNTFPDGYGASRVFLFRWDHWQYAILPVMEYFEIESSLNKVRLRNGEHEEIIRELEMLSSVSMQEQGYLNIHDG